MRSDADRDGAPPPRAPDALSGVTRHDRPLAGDERLPDESLPDEPLPDESLPDEMPAAEPPRARPPVNAARPDDSMRSTAARRIEAPLDRGGELLPDDTEDTVSAPDTPPPGVHNEIAPDDDASSPEPAPDPEPAAPPRPPPPRLPPIVDVHDLDWHRIRQRVAAGAVRARMRDTVERMEALLDRDGGPGLLFDDQRATPADRAIRVAALDPETPVWFVGDLHGDLLALEAALALMHSAPVAHADHRPRLVLLGDLFDDGGYGLELLLRVFELVCDDPGAICIVTGNHDDALGYNGARFVATVSPSDFAEQLNASLAHEWMVRAGKLAVRLFANAPRALFFPDGLLVAHGGFPLVDLHAELEATGHWNDPRCLTDFVWTRAHPKTRRKMPNRSSRGSQFGHEDFADFCALATRMGRPVTHMVRGHDHIEERWAVYPAYAATPMVTTNAMSRRLPREMFGTYERVPTVARWTPAALPQLHRLHVPPEIVRDVFPEPVDAEPDAPSGSVPDERERAG